MRNYIITLLFLQSLCSAQMPNLLKDINPGIAASKFGTFGVLPNNNILFTVITPSSATQGLWASDGSVNGTLQLRSLAAPFSNFIDYAGKKYFTASNPGNILWRSGGTQSTTDSLAVPSLSAAGCFSVANNLLFFAGITAANGCEIWRTDGSTAGTFMVKDIWPGAGSGVGQLTFLGVYLNSLYFIANDGITGQELWKSDGTSAGTSLILDILTGSGSSNIQNFSVGANGVYFTADNSTNGRELWFSDGSTAGTHMIKDVNPGSGLAIPGPITFSGNIAYYFYGTRIYRTDGSTANTTSASAIPNIPGVLSANLVANALPVYTGELYYLVSCTYPNVPSGYRDSIYFMKMDPSLTTASILKRFYYNSVNGSISWSAPHFKREGSHFIWILYAAPPGTGHVFIFNPATNSERLFYSKVDMFTGSLVTNYQLFGNKLYMPYNGQDSEPAYLDLANDSIYLIKNINSSGSSLWANNSYTWFHYIYTLNGKKYFLANDGTHGTEFWETDLTGAGTSLLKDIYPGTKNLEGDPMFDPAAGVVKGIQTPANIFFAADDGNTGLELWSFITAPSGTVGLPNPNLLSVNIFPNPCAEELNFTSSSETGAIKIYNALGELLLKYEKNSSQVRISLAGFAAGIYFVTMDCTEGSSTTKIIKSE